MNHRNWGLAALIGGVLMLSSGCATIVSGSDERVSVNSTPDEAMVEIRNRNNRLVERQQTPFTATLDRSAGYFRGETYTVTFRKEGYSSEEVVIRSRPSGWYLAGNLFFGGLIGWFIVDPLTGAMWVLTPDSVNAILDERPSQADGAGPVLHVILEEHVPDDLRAEMIRVR